MWLDPATILCHDDSSYTYLLFVRRMGHWCLFFLWLCTFTSGQTTELAGNSFVVQVLYIAMDATVGHSYIFCPNRAAWKCTRIFRQQSITFHLMEVAVTGYCCTFPITKSVPNLKENNLQHIVWQGSNHALFWSAKLISVLIQVSEI